jgi:hypothetical protein
MLRPFEGQSSPQIVSLPAPLDMLGQFPGGIHRALGSITGFKLQNYTFRRFGACQGTLGLGLVYTER